MLGLKDMKSERQKSFTCMKLLEVMLVKQTSCSLEGADWRLLCFQEHQKEAGHATLIPMGLGKLYDDLKEGISLI